MAGVELMKQTKREMVDRVQAVAGLSLGEYTALCAAGVLDFEDGLQLVIEVERKLSTWAMELSDVHGHVLHVESCRYDAIEASLDHFKLSRL